MALENSLQTRHTVRSGSVYLPFPAMASWSPTTTINSLSSGDSGASSASSIAPGSFAQCHPDYIVRAQNAVSTYTSACRAFTEASAASGEHITTGEQKYLVGLVTECKVFDGLATQDQEQHAAQAIQDGTEPLSESELYRAMLESMGRVEGCVKGIKHRWRKVHPATGLIKAADEVREKYEEVTEGWKRDFLERQKSSASVSEA